MQSSSNSIFKKHPNTVLVGTCSIVFVSLTEIGTPLVGLIGVGVMSTLINYMIEMD